VQGAWAPAEHFDAVLPNLLQVLGSYAPAAGKLVAWPPGQSLAQATLAKRLLEAVGVAEPPFAEFIEDLPGVGATRDYTSAVLARTTLGRADWVAEHQGARVHYPMRWGRAVQRDGETLPTFSAVRLTEKPAWTDAQVGLLDATDDCRRFVQSLGKP
jgi:hypothetical protein